jgi:hypothetical protein
LIDDASALKSPLSIASRRCVPAAEKVLDLSGPFVGEMKPQLVLAIPDFGNDDRSAKRKAKLIPVQNLRLRRKEVGRIQSCITDEVISLAVKAICSRLCNHIDYARIRTLVGHKESELDLELIDSSEV